MWGSAIDGEKIYAANNYFDPKDPSVTGTVQAFDLNNGEKLWSSAPLSCEGRKACKPSHAAAVTAIPGVVFSASMDGHLRGYSAEDGRVVWDFDTAREFQTVNGIKARGGSIDGPGPVVVNGMVFINSGYSRFGGMPGNVLLALAP